VIAFGFLLDTFLVRTILVPALVIELDRKVWWPSALAAGARRRTGVAIEAQGGEVVTGDGHLTGLPVAEPPALTPRVFLEHLSRS
jgi:hypothetical protein